MRVGSEAVRVAYARVRGRGRVRVEGEKGRKWKGKGMENRGSSGGGCRSGSGKLGVALSTRPTIKTPEADLGALPQ